MALTQKEESLYGALTKIKNDPALAPALEWLKEMRDTARDRLETCNDLHQVEQGKAQILKKILVEIEQAPNILRRS